MRYLKLTHFVFLISIITVFTSCEVTEVDNDIVGEWTLYKSTPYMTKGDKDLGTYLVEDVGLSDTEIEEKISEIESHWVDTTGDLILKEDGSYTSTLGTIDVSGNWVYDSYTLILNEQSIPVESFTKEVMVINISKSYSMDLDGTSSSLEGFEIEHRIILKK
jgi:hypothetical protein